MTKNVYVNQLNKEGIENFTFPEGEPAIDGAGFLVIDTPEYRHFFALDSIHSWGYELEQERKATLTLVPKDTVN